jgi:hypothetical protein
LEAAASLHQPWKILECVSSEETARQRLAKDSGASTHPAVNRDYQLYLEVKTRFETILHPKTIIDTDQPLAVCIAQAYDALR